MSVNGGARVESGRGRGRGRCGRRGREEERAEGGWKKSGSEESKQVNKIFPVISLVAAKNLDPPACVELNVMAHARYGSSPTSKLAKNSCR